VANTQPTPLELRRVKDLMHFEDEYLALNAERNSDDALGYREQEQSWELFYLVLIFIAVVRQRPITMCFLSLLLQQDTDRRITETIIRINQD
jgi:hypothetical protein